MDDYGRIIEFLPNLKDFPISRDVGLGVGKEPINVSFLCEFPQNKKFKKKKKKKKKKKQLKGRAHTLT